MKTFLLTTATYLALASAAFAGPFQYECTIEQMYNDDGSHVGGLLKMYQQDKVFIERDTGFIAHTYWANSRSDVGSLALLDRGNNSTYYKAVTYTVAGVLIAVTIEEFASGSKKPMALLENGKVMTGYCY